MSSAYTYKVKNIVTEQLNIKGVIGACILIDGCSLELCSATPGWHDLAYATEIKSIQLHDSIVMASPWERDNIIYITFTYIGWQFYSEDFVLETL